MNIPPTAYVALGAVLASLIAGFFSFLNLVSAKESKISEFRLSWIDGLRNEIAAFASAIHELVRIRAMESALSEKERLEIPAEPYKLARENLSKIQFRLNPEHVKKYPDGLEAKLMSAVQSARVSFNKQDYEEAVIACDAIREAAAPLLKQEWEKVKAGEPGYRRIRTTAWVAILVGVVLLFVGAGWLILSPPVVAASTANGGQKLRDQACRSPAAASQPQTTVLPTNKPNATQNMSN